MNWQSCLRMNVNNKVVIIARNRLKLEQLKRECQFQYPGAKIYPMVFDLGNGDFKHPGTGTTFIYQFSVDVLINNAGVTHQ